MLYKYIKGGLILHGLKKLLILEENRLKNIINFINKRIDGYPEGQLKIRKYKKVERLEQRLPSKDGVLTKYINKENIELAKKLAQKTYDSKVLKVAKSQLKNISKLNKEYNDGLIDSIYRNQCDKRKELVTPIIPTWEQTLEAWKNETYDKKVIEDFDSVIVAKKGHRVRSKSEKILADTFYDNNIAYKYEKPLNLTGYGVVYPDFTFLSPNTRKEIYWEHMGMMGDAEYLLSALKKIENYLKHNIYLGENLIVTFESSKYILNQDIVRKYIDKHLVENLT